MHMPFSEEEKRWIDRQPLNWKIKPGCPPEVRESITKKLKLINGQKY